MIRDLRPCRAVMKELAGCCCCCAVDSPGGCYITFREPKLSAVVTSRASCTPFDDSEISCNTRFPAEVLHRPLLILVVLNRAEDTDIFRMAWRIYVVGLLWLHAFIAWTPCPPPPRPSLSAPRDDPTTGGDQLRKAMQVLGCQAWDVGAVLTTDEEVSRLNSQVNAGVDGMCERKPSSPGVYFCSVGLLGCWCDRWERLLLRPIFACTIHLESLHGKDPTG